MKISCNLTKKDVQYLVRWDSSKKNVPYFPFSVPYVTIFINNFLHLLLNRCDVKLKPVLIDCSVFTSLGSFFNAFVRTFLCCCCCCHFSLVTDIKSTKKMEKATLSRLLSSEFEDSFTYPFIK